MTIGRSHVYGCLRDLDAALDLTCDTEFRGSVLLEVRRPAGTCGTSAGCATSGSASWGCAAGGARAAVRLAGSSSPVTARRAGDG